MKTETKHFRPYSLNGDYRETLCGLDAWNEKVKTVKSLGATTCGKCRQIHKATVKRGYEK